MVEKGLVTCMEDNGMHTKLTQFPHNLLSIKYQVSKKNLENTQSIENMVIKITGQSIERFSRKWLQKMILSGNLLSLFLSIRHFAIIVVIIAPCVC